ncbi:MAG: ABC transporter substrate-binding protein [Nitratireductor sp.]|nr:ABC transporter substrate-binding protein [Nitratireductor sp.]
MDRRNFVIGTAAVAGSMGFSVKLHAQDMIAASWIGPSNITPLQTYVLIAIEKGYLAEEGVNLTVTASPGTANAITQLAAGQAQFGQGASVTSVPAIVNQGAEVITVAQPIYESVFELASRPEAEIRTPQDLVGKTVGLMSIGGSTDKLLDAMMLNAGLDPNSVNKVVTGLSSSAVAFLERGEVDAFWSYYPIRVALDKMGIELSYLGSGKFAPFPPDSIICSSVLLKDDAGRELVQKYLRACARAHAYMMDPANTESCTDILGKYNPVEAEDRDATARKFAIVRDLAKTPEGVKPMYCDLAAWEKGIELMKSMNTIENIVPLDQVVTNSMLEAAGI